MKTLRLTIKRSLLGLFGMMVSAALCSSSTVPSFLPLAQERRDIAARQAVPTASTSASVAKGHRQGQGKAPAPRLAVSKANRSASSNAAAPSQERRFKGKKHPRSNPVPQGSIARPNPKLTTEA